VGVIVASAKDALRFYTDVFGMDDATNSCMLEVPGACVRVGEQTIQLMEVPQPDPVQGRHVHAGRDRHVAVTLHDLAPLKASLEANNHNYTMSYSGRQALFTRDHYGNGWEFGPPTTFEKNTRVFPNYLAPSSPQANRMINWGGVPHVGVLVSDTEAARKFYCDVLGMVDENDLRPVKLPFPGLFLRCGEQQVHIMQCPSPDTNIAGDRPAHGKDRTTAFAVKSLPVVQMALEAASVDYAKSRLSSGESVLYCRDPDANELSFIEDPGIVPVEQESQKKS
jgi:glyoxylase I family protein